VYILLVLRLFHALEIFQIPSEGFETSNYIAFHESNKPLQGYDNSNCHRGLKGDSGKQID